MSRRSLMRRARALLARDGVERELGDEVQFHLQMEIDELTRGGMPRDEAERQARLRFGGVDRHVEAHRDARGVRWIEDAIADARYALRSLARTPAFTLSTVLVLAVGIGASTAIFSAVNAVIIAKLPFPDDDRLVRIYNQNSPTNRWSLSVADVQGIAEHQRMLSSFGAMTVRQSPVSRPGADAVRTWTTPATAGMFVALGLHAAIGRVIDKSDEDPTAKPVVVVTDAFARRVFGDPGTAVGKILDVDGRPTTVVGVLGRGVANVGGFRTDIIPAWQPQKPTRRGPFGIVGIGRMKDGATLEATGRDLSAVSRIVFPQWAAGFADTAAHYSAVPLRDVVIGDAPKTLWMFVAAAALLLLIAITNVTNLMLARMNSRGREIALRAVLGASGGRLARLVVAETTLLAGIASLLGVAVGWALLRLLIVIASGMPRLATATIDLRAAAFAVGIGLLTGFMIGAHPIIALMRSRGSSELAGGNRAIGQTAGAARLRGALVAVEFALALPLLAGAGQLMDSITRLQRVDPGFDPTPLGYVAAVLPSGRYQDPQAIGEYWRRAILEASGVPGVASVSYTTELPPDQVGNTNNFLLEGSPVPPGGSEPTSPWLTVSPTYFETMGMRLIAGRGFTPADTGAGLNSQSLTVPQSLIVSESFARHYSPDRPIVGRRVFEGGCRAETCPPTYVVGVVSDVKYQGLAENGDAAYWPTTLGTTRGGVLMIRVNGSPDAVLPQVRARLQSLDRGVPIDEMASMATHVYGTTAAPRHWALLLAAFAVAALALAAIGTFGLLSYLVTMMWREIGVRVALGAQRGEIARMIVRRGVQQSALGIAAGLMIAIAGRRMLAASLYEVKAGDPVMLAAVALVLLGIAALASWMPALRAARIDPMQAMRAD